MRNPIISTMLKKKMEKFLNELLLSTNYYERVIIDYITYEDEMKGKTELIGVKGKTVLFIISEDTYKPNNVTIGEIKSYFVFIFGVLTQSEEFVDLFNYNNNNRDDVLYSHMNLYRALKRIYKNDNYVKHIFKGFTTLLCERIYDELKDANIEVKIKNVMKFEYDDICETDLNCKCEFIERYGRELNM